MGRPRFGAEAGFSSDLVSQRERARSALQLYNGQPLDDRPMIADATDDHRRRNAAYWKWYFNHVFQEIDQDKTWDDPDQIWLDLCRGTEKAKNYCRLFLRSYVEESVQRFAVLGPEEYESRRTVNSASSVTQCWRELIANADATVLSAKRREDPENFAKWRLKYQDHTHQRGQGPVFEISQWIFQTLAKELKLAVNLTTEKIEATEEDTVVLLSTLWQRADDIPCLPDTRLSFHGAILLAAIGGFRRGTIRRLRYRDVSLAVVRDPNDPSKTKLVVTPTIGKNKLRKATRVSRAVAISFSMTLVPFSPICLSSVVAARAIKDDAFEPSFETVEALLSRPALEKVDFLPLKWKDHMLDRPIFDLSDSTFYKLWHRTCLVAGLRVDPRFYAMRVGCGGRLDGVLSDALRNYILSNTSGVFQGSYQPKRVREDLMRLAFGHMAGRNDILFQKLRSMSLSRDANAPIDPSVADLREFEKRKDVSDLRASLSAAQLARDQKQVRSLKGRIEHLIMTLSTLRVQALRAAYFDRVDSLRAQGLPTQKSMEGGCLENALRKKNSNGLTGAIAQFLQLCTQDEEMGLPVEQRSKVYMSLLVDFLAHRPQQSKLILDPPGSQKSADEGDQNPNEGKRSVCLLCDMPFRGRSELTKHCRRVHVRAGTFERPFVCPKCPRQTIANTLIEGGPPAWSNHVERVHGKIHTPNLPSFPRPLPGSVRCLLCDGFFIIARGGLARHTIRTHDQKEGRFAQPFPCPECRRQGELKDANIDGIDEWYSHLTLVHNIPVGKRKRSGENGVDSEAESEHFASTTGTGSTPVPSEDSDWRQSPKRSKINDTRWSPSREQGVNGSTDSQLNGHLDLIGWMLNDGRELVQVSGQIEQVEEGAEPDQVQNRVQEVVEESQETSLDTEDSGVDVARGLWGRGYALVPEGRGLNRYTNNAQRREEISSDINSRHVITGKRERRRAARA